MHPLHTDKILPALSRRNSLRAPRPLPLERTMPRFTFYAFSRGVIDLEAQGGSGHRRRGHKPIILSRKERHLKKDGNPLGESGTPLPVADPEAVIFKGPGSFQGEPAGFGWDRDHHLLRERNRLLSHHATREPREQEQHQQKRKSFLHHEFDDFQNFEGVVLGGGEGSVVEEVRIVFTKDEQSLWILV